MAESLRHPRRSERLHAVARALALALLGARAGRNGRRGGAGRRALPARPLRGERRDRARRARCRADRDARQRPQHAPHREGRELAARRRSRGPRLIELDAGPPPDTLVVLPPAGRSENDRYPIAVTPGPRGVLTSSSTRIDGLVSLADVAHGRLEVVAVDDPVATLERLEHRIERNDRIRLPLTLLVGALAYIAAVFAPRLAPRVVLLALAANLWVAGWWLVALVALAAAAPPARPRVRRGARRVPRSSSASTPSAVALSPFGPSQAGRFYGVSNLLETMLLVPAILGPALLGRLGVALAGVSLVAVAGSRFGADGGGLLVLLAAYATLVVRVRAARASMRRRIAAIAVAAVVAGVALVGLDAAFGGSSHVTQAVGDGPGAVLGDIADRLELSARRTFDAIGPAFAVARVARRPRRRRDEAAEAPADGRCPRRAPRLARRQRHAG